MIDFLNV